MTEEKKYLTQEEYEKEEKSQKAHRTFNTTLSVVLILAATFILPNAYNSIQELSDQVSGVAEQRVIESEIGEILSHEGFVECRYKDSLGIETIGAGHRVLPTDAFGQCITPQQAITLLRADYNIAKTSVEKRYPWATGDVKLTLINMSFNIGENRLAGFNKMLTYLEAG